MLSKTQAYSGSHRKLVLAFDVGTTFSGVSYSILDPGEVPKITPVTRYPAQEHAGGDSKIPTILYYDNTGKVRAVGAEALQESIIEQAQDQGWVKSEWFKLHLRPKTLSASHIREEDIPPLPPKKSVTTVFADFLRYLFKCTKEYIEETHANGPALWASVQDNIEFVLTHPNGWEGAQQSQMRQAAVQAGLIPNTSQSKSRIQFVTEGEASLHFCIGNDLSATAIQNGQGVIVVDAGGGTIDLSAYHMQQIPPNSFQEIAPTECRLQGSIFISRRAREFLEEKLRGTRYGSPEDIACMAEVFDKSTKTKFRDSNEASYIKFGSARDSDPRVGIRSGQLKLPGTDVAALFEPSIQATVEAIEEQRRVSLKPISAIFLVGGFAASDWLFSRLQAALTPLDLTFCRPDQHLNKAVADGAVSFYLNHCVSARVARWTYGKKMNIRFLAHDPEHQRRSSQALTQLSGAKVIPNKWDTILRKGTQVSETREFRKSYWLQSKNSKSLGGITSNLNFYKGSRSPAPEWIDGEPEKFPVICQIVADTKEMAKGMVPRTSPSGELYYHQDFSVILLFGLTELKAQIAWMEEGVEKRGPATVVYEHDE